MILNPLSLSEPEIEPSPKEVLQSVTEGQEEGASLEIVKSIAESSLEIISLVTEEASLTILSTEAPPVIEAQPELLNPQAPVTEEIEDNSPETLDLEVVDATEDFEVMAAVKQEKQSTSRLAAIFDQDEDDNSQMYPGMWHSNHGNHGAMVCAIWQSAHSALSCSPIPWLIVENMSQSKSINHVRDHCTGKCPGFLIMPAICSYHHLTTRKVVHWGDQHKLAIQTALLFLIII